MLLVIQLKLYHREVCRRARDKERAKMQTAMADYRSKVKAKEGRRGRSEEDGKIHAAPVGGVLMGQRGQAMLQEKHDGSSSPERLV